MLQAEKPRLYLLMAALVFLSALALYLPSVRDGLLWDDEEFIARNAFISDCSNLGAALNPANLLKVLPVPMSARPLVSASLIADVCAGGGAREMRVTNVLLHAFNGALLFFLLLTLSGSVPAAFFGALVFVLHPASAEVVRIITFRSHLLGFFFFTSALLAAVFYARAPGGVTGTAAALGYFFSVMSVETPVVLPAAALLAVYYDSGREGLKRLAPLLSVLVLIGGFYLWFRAPRAGYALPGSGPGIAGPSAIYPASLFPEPASLPERVNITPPWREIYKSPAANLFTMSAITLDYLRALVLPLGLSTDYYPEVISSVRRGAWPAAGCLAALAVSCFLFYSRKLSGLALLLIFTALLPALNIFPVYNIRADRYLYLPLAGFALLAAAGLRRAAGEKALRRNLPLAAGCLWLVWLCALSARRAPEFRDDLSLFTSAAALNPGSPRAQANLAGALLHGGDCGKAVYHSRLASAADPGNSQLGLRLAYTLAWCGRREESAAELKVLPYGADSLFLSGLLSLKGNRPRAVSLLKAALQAAPRRRDVFLTLLLAEKKRPAGLSPRDREDLAGLEKAYKKSGLLF